MATSRFCAALLTTSHFPRWHSKLCPTRLSASLTFVRVYSGVLESGSYVFNSTKSTRERVGRLLRMHANKREEIDAVYAGDIAACVGLKERDHGRHSLR